MCDNNTQRKKGNVHVLDKLILASDILQTCESDLSDNGAQFTGCSRDTVSSGPVSRWEDFSGDNKGGRVGTEILEEVGETVEENERSCCGGSGRHGIVSEACEKRGL